MRPVLLSIINHKVNGELSKNKYDQVILFLYKFFICYTLIGEEKSNRLSNVINKYASLLENNYSDDELMDFISDLSSKLPSREIFINHFLNVGWSHHNNFYKEDKNKEKVKVVLEVYEMYVSANNFCNDFTIEHIYPDSEDRDNGQIGNLIPLEYELNKRCIGKSIEDKMNIYKESKKMCS